MPREYRVGDALEPTVLTVDGPSMKVFSVIMRDPNPIHFDTEFVRSLGLGDAPVNQGTINMAYPINVLLGMVETPGQLRTFRCRFQGSLYEGDTVTVGGAVTAVDDETFSVDVWLERQGADRVLTGSAVLARRPAPTAD